MSELVQRLRDRGWRLTAQRRVVAEVLTGEHIHLTAEAVYSRAQDLLPEISLA
ncbi:MAG: transcriptional repressor, partial [Acidimicrobiaceae bacterium]|nr:transcriptional repressor [Acidimicrobiaceae bacterium]